MTRTKNTAAIKAARGSYEGLYGLTETPKSRSLFQVADVLPSPEGYLEGTILSCRSDGQYYILAKGQWNMFQSFDKLLQKTKREVEAAPPEPAPEVALESSVYVSPPARKLTM